MPKRTDTKDKMIAAARRLFMSHGYTGTAFADVLEASSTSRGSVYFHFPGGKEELAQEVVFAHSAETLVTINRLAASAGSSGEFLERFLVASGERMARIQFTEGCAVAPLVVEGAAQTDRLQALTRSTFDDFVTTIAARLRDLGQAEADALRLAQAAVSSLEGCLIVARASRDISCFAASGKCLSAAAKGLQPQLHPGSAAPADARKL